MAKKKDIWEGSTGKLRKGVKSTPALRKEAAKRKEANDPNALTRPLTPKTAKRELAAVLAVRYGGTEANQASQLQASQAQQPQIGNWFGDYRKIIAESTARAQQASQEAQATIQSNAATSSATDEANRSKAQTQMQDSAASRGATVDPATEARAIQAAAARRAQTDAQGALTAQQGANAQTYLADRGRVAGLQQVEAHQAESARERAIRAAQALTATEKGEYGVSYAATQRNNERQNALANATFGLNVDKAGADAANDAAKLKASQKKAKADAKLKKRGQNVTARGQTLSHKDRVAAQAARGGGSGGGSSGGSKPYTPTQKNAARGQYAKGQSFLRKDYAGKRGIDQQKAIDLVLNKGGVKDPDIALAVVQMHKFGGVGPTTRRLLRSRYGLKLPAFPKRGLSQGRASRPD